MHSPAHNPMSLSMHAPGAPEVRLAGALYLVIILCGLSAELALRGPLVQGDAQAVAARIAAHLPQFRLGLLADLVMLLADIALALLFYALLRPVSDNLARAAMTFRLMQAALIGTSLIALAIVPEVVAAGDAGLARHMVSLHATGYDIGLILFGVNSLIMARLLHLSGGVPRVIAAGIAAAGLVYLTGGVVRLALPQALAAIQPAYLVPILAETALCLWLLIRARI